MPRGKRKGSKVKAKAKASPPDVRAAICVRMNQELFERIQSDAEDGDRTPPAQIRRILKQHYGLAEDED